MMAPAEEPDDLGREGRRWCLEGAAVPVAWIEGFMVASTLAPVAEAQPSSTTRLYCRAEHVARYLHLMRRRVSAWWFEKASATRAGVVFVWVSSGIAVP